MVAINRYPWWKYFLVFIVTCAGFIYALPNIYPPYPAIQIQTQDGAKPSLAVQTQVEQILKKNNLVPTNIVNQDQSLLVLFNTSDSQLKAKELVQSTLGNSYLVALNLAPTTPNWLKAIGAVPMKLGLDLRGGVHFLLQVGIDSVLQQRTEGELRSINHILREERIRYSAILRKGNDEVILNFKTEEALNAAYRTLSQRFNDFKWNKQIDNNTHTFILQGTLLPAALLHAREEIMEQAMNTLRNRVNELGVSEAIVQQQGISRIAVDLPGIQDSTQAQYILGKTATLEFRLADTEHDATLAVKEGPPLESTIFSWQGQPVLLKNHIVLRGSNIVGAMSGFSEEGQPNVSVRLGGAGESLFTKITADNIGKPMAVVYVETKAISQLNKDHKPATRYITEKRVISIATIQSALGSNFQITGLNSPQEARVLALLLRAGALPAPVTIIEERQIGPTLGQQNIQMGILSVEVGMGLVIIFMIAYYGIMGLIADIALVMNLVLIVAILSLLGATLTLPGIAGIVLTVGMAVDANVLIFERIREELRRGTGVQASIHAGYERAFVTILDSNITTLIVMLILFGLGSGTVKGLAITVTVGLVTSMFTAITGTRALVNLIYGRRTVKRLSIGI